MTAVLNAPTVLIRSRFSTKLLLTAAIAAFGNWLLYDHAIGISLAIFLAILAAGAFLMRPHPSKRRDLYVAAILLVLALLPLMEAVGTISVVFGILGTALAAVVVTGGLSRGWTTLTASTQRLLMTGAFQLVPDMIQAKREAHSQGRKWLRLNVIAGWIVPVLCGAIFLALFASANPMIELWLSVFDLSRQSWEIDAVRIFVWIMLFAIAWPFLSIRLLDRPLISGGLPKVALPEASGTHPIFGTAAIQRSLVLFNMLFAVQTVLDAMYLWGGASLPAGMTYATYAHRGAYPLIATALLAAAFVLATMRPGGAGEQSPIIRRLVYLWVGQNVLLVISSILRLDLYVDVYSLTFLRMTAFIWMLLVGIGLVLIVARIALGRSNGWLVGANVLALALTLYACSFMNFAALIANHNLSHKRDAMPGSASLDILYIRELGPHAIPAVDRYIARRGLGASDCLVRWRNSTARLHTEKMKNWQAWTFRDWRLQHYLGGRADAKEAAATSGSLAQP